MSTGTGMGAGQFRRQVSWVAAIDAISDPQAFIEAYMGITIQVLGEVALLGGVLCGAGAIQM